MKKFYSFFYIFQFFFIGYLGAEQDERMPPAAGLTCIESEPSGIIDGCVNVITGEFFDYEVDMIIPGPESLKVERMLQCNNLHPLVSREHYYWAYNHIARIEVEKEHGHRYIANFRKGLESSSTFNLRKTKAQKQKENGVLLSNPDLKQFDHGITNNSKRAISAQTNPVNREFKWGYKNKFSKLTMENGKTLSFTGKYNLVLDQENYPSGLHLKYSYYHRRTKSASLVNAKDETLSSYSIEYHQEDNIKKINASDGRFVCYVYEDDNRFDTPLKCVNRTDAPQIKYSYYPPKTYIRAEPCVATEKDYYHENFKLASKTYPEERFKQIVYYTEEMAPLQNHYVDTGPDQHHFRRVAQILAPIGPTAKAEVKYRFYYHLPNGPKGEGVAGVHDALGRHTDYTFNHRQRLTGVSKYFANGAPYTKEAIYWGPQENHIGMRLYTRAFKVIDAPYETYARLFNYDDIGNVLNDYLCGNICGTINPTIQIDANGAISGQYDCYYKSYSYSNDQYNLLTESKVPSIRKTFHYLPDSNLLEACLHHDSQGIFLRHFYTYDDNKMTIEHMIDDGTGLSRQDLSNLTERKIERIERSESYPVGLPLVVKEYHYDPKTGQEHLILKKVNTHDNFGRLIRQETYGSDEQFCFAEEWTYDPHGNILLEVNRLGQQIVRAFDANDNMTYQRGPDQNLEKKFKYDYMNRLIQIDENHSDGILTKQYRYDLCGNPIATIDVLGNETNTEYDEFNRPIKVIGPPLANGQRPVIQYEYDELSKPVKITSPEGYVTKFAYTLFGKPYQILYPDGTTEYFEYDIEGRLVNEVAKNGVKTCYTHDAQGRVVKKECYDAQGAFLFKTEAHFSTFHLLEEVDAAGTVTKYAYDHLGRKIEATTQDRITSFEYDSLGRIVKTIAHDGTRGTATCAVFDPLNRVIEERTESFEGNVLTLARFEYDASGNKCRIEQEGSITTMEYDSHGVPRKVIDPEGNITFSRLIFDYINPNGQRVFALEVTDPSGIVTLSIQDPHGRVVEIVKKNQYGEVLQKTEYQKNSEGLCTETLETVFLPDQTTRQILNRFEYDFSGRLVAMIQALGTSDEKRSSIQYNTLGQKISSTKPNGGVLLYTYDSWGRLSEFSSSDGSIHYRYTYDICSNPIQVENIVDGNMSCRMYDPFHRIIEEKLANSLACQMTYTPEGHLKSLKLPDRSSIQYNYEGPILKQIHRFQQQGELAYSHEYLTHDLAGRLVESSLIHNLGKLSYEYTLKGQIGKIASSFYQAKTDFDPVGNLVKKSYEDSLGEQSENFTYDSLNQLTSEKDHTYTNDSIYNRCSKDGRLHSHNALNQLLTDGNIDFSYDLNGNLIKESRKDSTRTFTYDASDRLKTLQIDDAVWEFFYDELNRCVSFRHNSTTEKILYLAQNDIGTCDEEGNIHTLRVLGKGLGAEIGAAVALEINGEAFAPLHDHNGNVATLVDASGTVADTYRYTAFGEVSSCSLIPNPWRFASKRNFGDYLLFGRRFYDPEQGRWLTPDPLGYHAGSNLYAYLSNNPLIHFDLYGLIENTGSSLSNTLSDFINRACDSFSSGWNSLRDSFSSGYETLREGVRSICHSLRETTGTALNICKQIIMFPILRDVPGALEHLIQEGTLKGYQWPWNLDESQWVDGPGEYTYSNLRAILTNGIFTTLAEFREQLKHASEILGTRVDGVYNATSGSFVWDILKTLLYKTGIIRQPVEIMVKGIRESIQVVGPDGTVAVTGFSQGGQVIYSAIKELFTEERKMLAPCALGSAMSLPKELGLKYSITYNSKNDPVPLAGDPYHYRQAQHGKMPEMEFLDPLESGFIDHSFQGKTYTDALIRFSNTIHKLFLDK